MYYLCLDYRHFLYQFLDISYIVFRCYHQHLHHYKAILDLEIFVCNQYFVMFLWFQRNVDMEPLRLYYKYIRTGKNDYMDNMRQVCMILHIVGDTLYRWLCCLIHFLHESLSNKMSLQILIKDQFQAEFRVIFIEII